MNRFCNFSQPPLNLEEFISEPIDDVYELCPLYFISKAQANYLKTARENLLQNEVIVLLCFAEN